MSTTYSGPPLSPKHGPTVGVPAQIWPAERNVEIAALHCSSLSTGTVAMRSLTVSVVLAASIVPQPAIAPIVVVPS